MLTQPKEDKALQIFLDAASHRSVRKGGVIIKVGVPSNSLYYLIKGNVAVSIDGPHSDKQQLVVRYLSPGQFFGEMGLFQAVPTRSALVVARTQCEIAEISYDDFKAMAQKDLSILFRVCRQLTERLSMTTKKIGDLAFMDTKGRVAGALLEMCKQSDAMTHPLGMMVKVTRQELAKNVGCSREMVGRVLKELEEDGHLEASGMSIVVYGTR